MYKFFKEQLNHKINNHNLRTLKEYCPLDAVRVKRDDKEYLMMASNNYLGLTFDPRVIEGAVKGAQQYGTGSGGSRLVSGTFPLFTELENALAKFKNTEKALVFNTGYMANVGTISAIADKNTIIFSDALNHASIIDGCRLSRGTVKTYSHCDIDELKYLLKQVDRNTRKLIVTDGVFSMDGDIADIPAILEITKKYNALLLIDDAHATGVIGEDGAGTLSYYDIKERENIIVTGTLSKAIGSIGGFITAKQNIIDYLRVYARSNMYSTSLPQSICAASLEVIKEMRNTDIQNALKRNAEYVRNGLRALGFNTLNSMTPIIPVIVGDEYILTQITKELYDRNIFTNAIFPPVVPPNMCRIRIGVMSSHTFEDCDRLINAFHEIGKKYGLI